jgi:hypothetical protein
MPRGRLASASSPLVWVAVAQSLGWAVDVAGSPARGGRSTVTSKECHMGSVIKKRRKRMAKKKHRKLLRKTRHQRRNKK